MKIIREATGVQTFKDSLSGARIGFVECDYKLDISPKEIRQIGFNLGYGITKGCIMAYVTAFAIYGACKAIKDYAEKHSKIQEPETKEVVAEEPAEEK